MIPVQLYIGQWVKHDVAKRRTLQHRATRHKMNVYLQSIEVTQEMCERGDLGERDEDVRLARCVASRHRRHVGPDDRVSGQDPLVAPSLGLLITDIDNINR